MSTRTRSRQVLLITLAALALGAPPAHAAYGLAGEWLLDESAGSSVSYTSGSGQHGRLGDGASMPSRVFGVSGFGLRFDGDDEVIMPDSSLLEPPRLTVESWVRNPASPGAFRYVISKGAAACDASSYGLYTGSGGGLAFYVKGASGFVVSAQAPAAVWDGAWHHAVGTYDGETVRLFIDGKQVGSAKAAPSEIAYGLPSKSLRLGTYRGDCDLPFTGEIDTVRIWNLALTSGEVAAAPANPLARPQVDRATPRPGTPSRSPTATTTAGCLKISPATRSVRIGRRTILTMTVRRGSRRAARIRVALSGKGIRTTVKRTNRLGVVRFVVKPRRKVTLRLRAYGSRAGCKAPVARVTTRR